MNYPKPNPKSHDQMYVTFQGNILSRNTIILRQKNMQDRRDFELAKAQVMQIDFIFLESKICLKQIQRLKKKFYCENQTPKIKYSIWSYKKTYFRVEEGNCRAPSISKYRKRFGTGLAKD